jgi:HAD superfamily hydrolase (TIGR01484 family)
VRRDLPLILATDLDGTFLHGTAAERRAGYDFIRTHRADIGLLYVTGRELERVVSLAADPEVPWPDHIICDVGTMAVDGQTLAPFSELAAWVDETWGDANDRIRTLLEGEIGIRVQPVTPAYRVSYYYEPHRLMSSTVDRIIAAGFDCLISDGRYLDVMPRGINKGTMLLRLLDLLALPGDRVVVCGDTLNDLSLFDTGLTGIVVGNAEPKLLDAVAGLDSVYRSRATGIAGIVEGLRHWHRLGRLPDHPMYCAITVDRQA